MSDPSEQPRRRRRQPQTPPPVQGSIARGAVLVVIAVILGVILIRNDDSTVTPVVVGAATNPDAGGDADNGTDPSSSSTTSSTVPARPASQVKVLVANGSDVNGAAGAQTDVLEALGYVTATPTNGDRVPATIVYYSVGFEAEARELATAIGAAADAVAMLPTVAPVEDLQLANILVIVGPDLATGG